MLICLAVSFITIGCILYLVNYVKETFKTFWPKRKPKVVDEVVEVAEVVEEDSNDETEEKEETENK